MKKKTGKKGATPTPEGHCHAEAMSCKSVVMEALYDFEEGSMPDAERTEFERHLQACPPCVRFLDSYRATGRTLRALKPRDIPPTLARTVFEFVKARCSKK
jgi:anti-sigma factor RsiW